MIVLLHFLLLLLLLLLQDRVQGVGSRQVILESRLD
jgi:hypothetical protein